MIFHVDLIKFNSMKKCAQEHEAEIQQLYNALGEIELAICIMQYRKKVGAYCCPEFQESDGKLTKVLTFTAKNMYHPLVNDPVKNSLHTNKSLLLTGSNASGKSTFLKHWQSIRYLRKPFILVWQTRFRPVFIKFCLLWLLRTIFWEKRVTLL